MQLTYNVSERSALLLAARHSMGVQMGYHVICHVTSVETIGVVCPWWGIMTT